MAELGDGSKVGTENTAKQAEFVAELISFTFQGGVTVAHNKTETISGPHWEKGKDAEIEEDWSKTAQLVDMPDKSYSKRSAAFLVKDAPGAKHDVSVVVKVTKSENIKGSAVLTGVLGGLSVEGKCPTSVGEHTIVATIKEPPATISWFHGPMAWGLSIDDPGLSVSLGTALAECFFILDQPIDLFQQHGVWSDALRFLCGKVGVLGGRKASETAEAVTRYCHSPTGRGYTYDTFRGGAKFTESGQGGWFELWKYITKKNRQVNCYDQAAAVQVFCGCLGVKAQWLYMAPYGLITITDLVGVGACNNPFFEANGAAPTPLVDENDPRRTGFGNHAFCSSGGRILDACAGPHVGDEERFVYVDRSIDHASSLYSDKKWIMYGRLQPGTVANIRVASGVSQIL